MHRWATFFLLFLLLLVQARPAAANARFASTRLEQPFSAGTPAANGLASDDCTSSPRTKRNVSTGQACLASNALATLSELVQGADRIVRGRVTASHSFWSADQRLIESDMTIDVAYTLLGKPQQTVTIRTAGGFLAVEGLGMVSMHEATLTVGEEILAFVYQQGAVWRMVGGATGKFLVQQNMALNQDRALAQPLDTLLPTIVDLIKQRGFQSQVPAMWRHLTTSAPAAPMTTLATQNDKRKWTTPHATAAFTINLNTAQAGGKAGSRADFRQAIVAAANSWSQAPDTDFALIYAGESSATQTGYNGVNEVLFMHKGQQERAAAAQVWFTADGTIVEADIWINDDYAWNATGSPAADEVDLQSALLHEFGHWLILGHCTDSHAVMFARLTTGILKRELQPPDIHGISAIYPR